MLHCTFLRQRGEDWVVIGKGIGQWGCLPVVQYLRYRKEFINSLSEVEPRLCSRKFPHVSLLSVDYVEDDSTFV